MTPPRHDEEVRAETHTRVDVDPVSGVPHQHHEDPDEVPHDVIGVLALSLALIAMFVAVLWLTIGPLAAAIGGAIAGAIAIVKLTRRAARERIEEQHLPKDQVERAPPPGRDHHRPDAWL